LLISNYYAEELLHSPLYFSFYRTPKHIGLLESVFRATPNRSRARPPSLWRAGLLTISLVHHRQEGQFTVQEWPLSISCFRTSAPSHTFQLEVIQPKKWAQTLTYDNLSKSLHTFPLGFYHSLLCFKTSGLLWPLRKSSALFILYPR